MSRQIANPTRLKSDTKGAPMTEINSPYTIGDWVVHHSYGIGLIKKIEDKHIHGDLVACFKVKSKDGVHWWFSRNDTNNPRIRPIVTLDILHRAKKELQKTIRDIEPDRNMLRIRIEEVRASDDLIATSQLVRDLTIIRTQRKLNQTELRALRHFTDRLLREWSAAVNMDVEVIRLKLNSYLKVCREQANVLTG
jgi:RNA polymerase-interacting CarD/CdnL/TRCF family regulator